MKRIRMILLLCVCMLLSSVSIMHAQEDKSNSDAQCEENTMPLLLFEGEETEVKTTTPLLANPSGDFTQGFSCYDLLSGQNAILYQEFKTQFDEVAVGNRISTIFSIPAKELLGGKTTFTAEELGIDAIVVNGAWAPDVKAAVYAMFEVDNSVVIDAILNDSPYERYWYGNKTYISRPSYLGMYDYELGEYVVEFDDEDVYSFLMTVNPDYAGEEEYTVDQSKARETTRVVEYAKQIVADAEGLRDVEKLAYYRDRICDLVEYNQDAAKGNYPGGYGDPWQIIWVFDQDPATNVVCEGYAKAFKYLCDLSTFEQDIYVYLVGGDMSTVAPGGEGPHMWNIVHMEDGRNYLIDVTMSDGIGIGVEGKTLFMKPYSFGGLEYGYYKFMTVTKPAYYMYDMDTLALYSSEMLTLSGEAYGEEMPAPEPDLTVNYSHTLTLQNNLSINYYVSAENLLDYDSVFLYVEKDTYDKAGNKTVVESLLNGDLVDVGQGLEYKFRYTGIASYEVGNEVRAHIFAMKDGEVYEYNEDVYSIKTYCYNQLKKTSTTDKLKKLIVDLLNYCSLSQEQFGIRTDAYVNTELTEEQKEYGSSECKTLTDDTNTRVLVGATAEISGKTLVLGNNVELKVYMRLPVSVDKSKVTLRLSYTNMNGKIITKDIPFREFAYNKTNDEYSARFADIIAPEFRNVISIAIYDNGTQISSQDEYSIGTYAYNRVNSNTSTELMKKLVQAMMMYSDSAGEYFK